MLDHFVYAAPDLAEAVDEIEARLGVRPASGGRHAGGLTHNALLSLGEGSYLEVIAPVPGVELPSGALPFGLVGLTAPRLAAWAVATDNLERLIETARAAGYDPGEVVSGGRDLPGGSRLSWKLALRPQPGGEGVVPFVIQWTAEPHPSQTVPAGCRFVSLRGEHPAPDGVRVMLEALAVDLEVAEGAAPRLVATVDTPNGRLELS